MESLSTKIFLFLDEARWKNRQILYALHSHLAPALIVSKSEKNGKLLSINLGLVHKERSITAEAAHNNVNQEPRMLMEILVLPLSIASPNTGHRGSVPRLTNDSSTTRQY